MKLGHFAASASPPLGENPLVPQRKQQSITTIWAQTGIRADGQAVPQERRNPRASKTGFCCSFTIGFCSGHRPRASAISRHPAGTCPILLGISPTRRKPGPGLFSALPECLAGVSKPASHSSLSDQDSEVAMAALPAGGDDNLKLMQWPCTSTFSFLPSRMIANRRIVRAGAVIAYPTDSC